MSKVYSKIGTEGECNNTISYCRIWFLKQSIHSSHIPIHIFREDYPFKWCLQFHRCIELLVLWILFLESKMQNPPSRRICQIDIEWFSYGRNKLHSCVGLSAGEPEEVARGRDARALPLTGCLQAVSWDRPVQKKGVVSWYNGNLMKGNRMKPFETRIVQSGNISAETCHNE